MVVIMIGRKRTGGRPRGSPAQRRERRVCGCSLPLAKSTITLMPFFFTRPTSMMTPKLNA